MKGLFIVFEGIDGSGTSTQAELLKQYFEKNNKRVILTSEPSNGPIGNLIRQAMKKRVTFSSIQTMFDRQMAYLFAADRHDHLFNDLDGVYNFLNDGITVISTRYFFSSYAYHCNNEEDYEFVNRLNKDFPNPDLVVYIDNPVELSIRRMQNRAVKDMYENAEKLQRVKRNYQKIFADYSGDILIVDGNLSIGEIKNKIINYVNEVESNGRV